MSVPLNLLSKNFVKTRNITHDTAYAIERVNAIDLLCPQRIDLTAKIAYIESKVNGADMSFARELYRKHIEAFSEGYFTEPGDENKTNLEAFFSAFDDLIENISKNGFDESLSLIPVGKNNIILDGAHRTACAIYFQKEVTIIRFDDLEVNFDYTYFRKRHLSEEMLEYMAVLYSKYCVKNLYFACIWPVANESLRTDAIDMIRKDHRIVLDTNLILRKNGLRNLMIQIYQHQDWIGSIDNHFQGVMGKVDDCFAPGKRIEAIMFESGELAEIISLKDRIRSLFKIDKHALHISDNSMETNLMASLLLNENSRFALNYGRPDEFTEAFENMNRIKSDSLVLNEAATLAYFGICSRKISVSDNSVDCYNPRTYYIYDGMKLPIIGIVVKNLDSKDRMVYTNTMRMARLSKSQFQNNHRFEDYKTSLTWTFRKTVIKFKQLAMRITKRLGVYELLHSLYRGKGNR